MQEDPLNGRIGQLVIRFLHALVGEDLCDVLVGGNLWFWGFQQRQERRVRGAETLEKSKQNPKPERASSTHFGRSLLNLGVSQEVLHGLLAGSGGASGNLLGLGGVHRLFFVAGAVEVLFGG
jgi:hypothetical protein